MNKIKLKQKICISLLSDFYWYNDMVLPLYYSLQKLGYTVYIKLNQIINDATNIIIGFQDAPYDTNLDIFPNDTIIYNSEQIGIKGSKGCRSHLIRACQKFILWDYSEENIKRFNELGIRDAFYVPLGFCSEMQRINSSYPQDIDIGFYGAINPYRKKIIDALHNSGIKIYIHTNTNYIDRDCFIARCKMVLNMHQFRPGIQEIVRLGYLWANKKCVLCEKNSDTSIVEIYSDACFYAAYENLVDTAIRSLKYPDLIAAQAEKGYNIFKQTSYVEILDSIVEASGPRPVALPKILNIGHGNLFRYDAINIDIKNKFNSDIDLDISKKLDSKIKYQTVRFGSISLTDCMFDKITVENTLEHVTDLITTMTNLLNLLNIGGELHIKVPYDLSYGAWQDPTNVRVFNEKSWMYYTDLYWYINWRETKFDLISLSYVCSELGSKMIKNGTSKDLVMLTPRAIDQMNVILRKRYTTDAEKFYYDKVNSSIYGRACSPWTLNPYIS
ncbi:MAG: hypothetical protein IJU79_05815 [Desulfovibrionaceae bacterium]|nr:hypothetical protein [Desulfovibrionaceae bacterium]